MKRIMLELTDELATAIEVARGTEARNPAIESWLWRITKIKAAAKKLKLVKPTRKKRGRPSNAK